MQLAIYTEQSLFSLSVTIPLLWLKQQFVLAVAHIHSFYCMHYLSDYAKVCVAAKKNLVNTCRQTTITSMQEGLAALCEQPGLQLLALTEVVTFRLSFITHIFQLSSLWKLADQVCHI